MNESHDTNPSENSEFGECPECGAMACRVWSEDYQVFYECSECEHEGSDSFADLYGCMSVPWGFLL